MRRHVLACDPDPQTRRALQLILRGAGYDVLVLSGGQQLLEAVARQRPDAVVLELRLSDVDGFELCRTLREQCAAPVVVVSEMTHEEAKIEAFEAGADDYLTKPFSPGELVARLGAVLRRAPTGRRIEADGLMIDLQRQLVTVDGRYVHLTPIEYSLLRALVTSRGPVARDELAAEVWGERGGALEPRLRTHIARLRAKLDGKHRARELIRTEVGFGYRFAGVA